MRMRHLLRAIVIAVAVLAPATAVAASAHPTVTVIDPDEQKPTLAWFEGRQVDLSKGWGQAKACLITYDGTICFRSESQMDRYLRTMPTPAEEPSERESALLGSSRAATMCSSSLRLYDGANHTGSVLSTAIRWIVLNLPNYGWDNRTSSVRVGSCGAEFFSGSYGGGSVFGAYPGQWLWWMPSGWDNIVTSVYIY